METSVSRQYLDSQIDGWMTIHELNWLFHEAETMENVVGIGSWMGRSSHALLSGCPGIVYCVDHFKGSPTELDAAHKLALTEDIHVRFMRNVGHFKNLKVLKMDSIEASKLFKPKSVDMVFIDGEHTKEQAKADMEMWFPKCRKLLCGHDMNYEGVTRALKEIDLPYRYENPTWTIWSVRL